MTYENLYSLDTNSSTCYDMMGNYGGKEHLSAFACWNDMYAVASRKHFLLFDEETRVTRTLGGLPNWKEVITTVDPYYNNLFTCTTDGNVAIYDIWEPMFPKFCSKFADKSCLTDIKFSSHNQCFATGGQSNTLMLFDMRKISNDME